MITLLLVASLAATGQLPMTTLHATPRGGLDVLLVWSGSARSRVELSALQHSLTQEIESQTSLRVRRIDVPTRECAGRIACLCEAVAPTRVGVSVNLLFILNIRSEDLQPDVWVPLLVDVERAVEIARRSSNDDDAETAIELDAIRARPPVVTIDGPPELPAAMASTIAALEVALTNRGVWRTMGAIDVESPPNLPLTLDGALLGLTGERTRVRDVRTGTRTLTVGHTSVDVVVHASAVAQVHVETPGVLARPSLASWIQGSGAVLCGAGVAAMVLAAVTAEPHPRLACRITGPDSGACTPDTFDRLNDTGPLVLPLGYSLFGVGAAMALGPETEAFDPLWWVLIGLAVGATTYGLSEVAN